MRNGPAQSVDGDSWTVLATLGAVRLSRVMVVACVLASLTSCTAQPSTSMESAPTYTCCEAGDIDRTYRRGETLILHWVVDASVPGGGEASSPVELTASLTGPYPTVGGLKADSSSGASGEAVATFTAEPVRPSGQAGERPTSAIPIPPTAGAGYYNLITSVDTPNSSVSSASVIHVVEA
jgi:hypothetical protein